MSPSDSLRRRTGIAVLWSGFGNYGSSAVRLVSILALGWLLPPTDFGLLALALIFTVFAEAIADLGLGWALIQQKEVSESELDTVFWCGLILSLSLAAINLLCAKPVTTFLGDPAAAPLLRLLSPVLVISSLSLVPRAILFRAMNFRQVSLAQIWGEVAFGVVGLTLAGLGLGAWSLGGAVLAHRTVSCAYLLRSARWRPSRGIDPTALRRLAGYGSQVMAGNALERVLLNADYFVIGRFLGTQALGYYSLAFQLALIPLDRLVGAAHRVIFPAFSIVQDDLQRLKSGLLKGLRHLCQATLPVAMSIVILGPWLLRGIYGGKWESSIPPLRLLGLAGLFFVPRLFEAALLALGRPRIRFWLSFLRLAAFAALVSAFGLRHGITGVAASVGGALVIWGAAYLAIATRILQIRWREIGAAVWPVARTGLAALSPLMLFLWVPLATLSPWTALAYCAVTMGAIYLALMLPIYWQPLLGLLRRIR